jgi:hypothetical protein
VARPISRRFPGAPADPLGLAVALRIQSEQTQDLTLRLR